MLFLFKCVYMITLDMYWYHFYFNDTNILYSVLNISIFF